MSRLSTELLIEPSIVRDNILQLKSQIENKSNFMAIIKSDAYGHILPNIVRDIDDLVDGYGVVRLEEAIELRQISKKKILLMTYLSYGKKKEKTFLAKPLLVTFLLNQHNYNLITKTSWDSAVQKFM